MNSVLSAILIWEVPRFHSFWNVGTLGPGVYSLVFPCMAFTRIGYKISHESVLNSVYDFVRVYPNYKQSMACAIDLIRQVKEKKSNDYNQVIKWFFSISIQSINIYLPHVFTNLQ